MSKAIETFLAQNPLLTKYVQMGLVKITSLARYIKDTNTSFDKDTTTASISMSIRRYFLTLPTDKPNSIIDFKTPLNLIVRSNLSELIFVKDTKNRLLSRNIFQQIDDAKYFSCLVEGEKEIVLITDFNLNELLKKNNLKKHISNKTSGLGFISIDLPISLRQVVGVYSRITSALAVAQIAIHSFHTLGGEILILVENRDLLKAQEVLS